jgi:hypothetical protein
MTDVPDHAKWREEARWITEQTLSSSAPLHLKFDGVHKVQAEQVIALANRIDELMKTQCTIGCGHIPKPESDLYEKARKK